MKNFQKNATKPVAYVFAWNNNSSIRDVSIRYCLHWIEIKRTKRAAKEWLDSALARYKDVSNEMNAAEDTELSEVCLQQNLPKVISE